MRLCDVSSLVKINGEQSKKDSNMQPNLSRLISRN